MRLKSKPKKPVRKTVTNITDLNDLSGSLDDAIKYLRGLVQDDENVISQEIVLDCGYDYSYTELHTKRLESDEAFKVRMEAYEKRQEEYEAWYEANKDEVETELALRKNKKEYAKHKEIKRLQEKLDKLKSDG